MLPRLLKLGQPTEEALADFAALSRELLLLLLVQLTTTSGRLRLTVLEAVDALPHLDAEAIVRAIRIPAFRKVTQEEEESAAQLDDDHERWHGALYFILDDEDPHVRAAVLKTLRALIHRPEVSTANCKHVEGLFQRMAALSSLCLVDDEAGVREAAADVLVSAMNRRGVALTVPAKGKKTTANDVHVTSILQALRVDRKVALRVLSEANFQESTSLEVAVSHLLEFDQALLASSPGDEEQLRDTLAKLGCRYARDFEPLGTKSCTNRIGGARGTQAICHGLGHRLFTKALEASRQTGTALNADAMDMGVLPLHCNSPRLSRLRVLLQAVASERSAISSCVPGVEPLPRVDRPTGGEGPTVSHGPKDTLLRWAAHLGACYGRARSVEQVSATESGHRERRHRERTRLWQQLQALRHSTANAAAEEPASCVGGLRGPLQAIAAWSSLFVAVLEALEAVEAAGVWHSKECVDDDDAKAALLVCGAQLHVAVSQLMHGFCWRACPKGFPQVLLAFRLMALRLLAGDPLGMQDFQAACRALGFDEHGTAQASSNHPTSFLPRLPEGYFAALLTENDCGVLVYDACISRVVDACKPQSKGISPGAILPVSFPANLGGQLRVTVQTNVKRGIHLRMAYPCGAPCEDLDVRVPGAPCEDLDVPVPGTTASFPVPVGFPRPMEAPGVRLRLQLFLHVDACAAEPSGAPSVQLGATGVRRSSSMYRELNELPLGPPRDVPFTATVS